MDHGFTRVHENGPNEVSLATLFFSVLMVKRRYSNGVVLPCTTTRWKFGTLYDG